MTIYVILHKMYNLLWNVMVAYNWLIYGLIKHRIKCIKDISVIKYCRLVSYTEFTFHFSLLI